MEQVIITNYNNVYLQIHCSQGILNELSEYFSFYAPNYKFHPKYKKGQWSGKIFLLQKKDALLYCGLEEQLKNFCERNNYNFINDIKKTNYWKGDAFFDAFIESLDLPHTPYSFQIDAVKRIIKQPRGIILSPTSSGKSLIQYLICRYFSEKRFLIIVPTINLVGQLATDFKEYGYDKNVYQIMSGVDKDGITNRITTSTWHSIKDLPKKWFDQFDAIMVDEAHTAQAKSLINIMLNCEHQNIKIGLSGTLPDEVSTTMTLEGLFGPIFRTITTKELIDNKQAADLNIVGIELEYPPEIVKDFKEKKLDYRGEVDYIISLKQRQLFITKLAKALKGNKLILFKRVEHGKAIFELLHNEDPDKVHFIYGKVAADIRNQIRQLMEQQDGIIAVASFKTFATGTNIKNLHYIIFAENTKSMITVLQAVGRALRISKTKLKATIFDIGDSIIRNKTKQNYAWKHFITRLEYYTKEKFNVSIKKHKL